MKNKIKKFLSLCILVPTLVLSPIQTQAFAITATVTLGMFVNFLVSTVIVAGVVYEFTNGSPDMGYTDYKDILSKNDTSKYKFNNASLLSVKSATDLVTLGLTPLEANNIVEAYDEYCEYYETVPETEPYTFKKSSVISSTVSLAKSLNFVVSDVTLPSLTPALSIDDSNYYNYMSQAFYLKMQTWNEVYYYIVTGYYSGNTTNFGVVDYYKIARGEMDFKPTIFFSDRKLPFYNGDMCYISTGSGVQVPLFAISYDKTGKVRTTYYDNIANRDGLSMFLYFDNSFSLYPMKFSPPSDTATGTYYRNYLLATNDDRFATTDVRIPADVISKNLISVGSSALPVANKIVGSDSIVTDIVLPYKPVDSITVLPGSIALAPSSVDEYKNSIVADESFSLTLPVEDVIVPPVDGTQDLSGILEFLQRILDGILAIPRAITQTITDFFSAQPTTTIDFSPLFISLADKFPFCLPFDLFNAFKSFVATPVVPKFEITFDKGLVGAGSFTFDFAPFTKLAAILRYFILLVFVTSLINKTKNMIN